ncbi:DUF2236 domain-containing protein [Weeksellaceae bacterium KMM 9713]|uniref:DUF2236 domain-containing protein n=1 Tax=Profundicola chukchiensis TaxID=2961959 RepID=A0A9X4RUF1_9FLAO|nr:oxygenase MpaB family protein [Profundicola chukchiensis]MDG4946093.1 DUF2236 domain-containing protein [Profundicola chukchiensis]
MIENKKNIKFWKSGNGRDFLDWAGLSEVDLNSDFSTSLFEEYDEKCDQLTQNWIQSGDFKNIMKSLHGFSNSELPKNYIQFRDELKIIPDWVDTDLIKLGSQLSERSGLNGLLILRNFALLGGYTFANLTKPLVATGSLEKGAIHRLYNTLKFWVEVTRSNTSTNDLRFNACLQTRLIHSASRLMIEKKFPNWDIEKNGVPINHADMIATHMAFTVYYLYGLNQLNFEFSEREEAGVFHLWKYITYLLGVPLELIPNNRKEALSFFYFWTKYQLAPDEDALKLTDSLLNEDTPISLFYLKPINQSMGYVHKSVANYLIDANIRKNLQIPSVVMPHMIPNIIQLKNKMTFNKKKQLLEGRKHQAIILKDYKNNIT